MIKYKKHFFIALIFLFQNIILSQSKGVELPFALLEDEHIKWIPTIISSNHDLKKPTIFASRIILETQREDSRVYYKNKIYDSLGSIDYNSVYIDKNKCLQFVYQFDDEPYYFYDGEKIGPYDAITIKNNCVVAKKGFNEYALRGNNRFILPPNTNEIVSFDIDSPIWFVSEDDSNEDILFMNGKMVKKYDKIYDIKVSKKEALPFLSVSKKGHNYIEWDGKLSEPFDSVYQMCISESGRKWAAYVQEGSTDCILLNGKRIVTTDELLSLEFTSDTTEILDIIYKVNEDYYVNISGQKYGPFPNQPKIIQSKDNSSFVIVFNGLNPNETFVQSSKGFYGPYHEPKIRMNDRGDKVFVLDKDLKNSYNLFLNNQLLKTGDYGCWVEPFLDTSYALQEFIDNKPYVRFSNGKTYDVGKVSNPIQVFNSDKHWLGVAECETGNIVIIDGEISTLTEIISKLFYEDKLYVSGETLEGGTVTYIDNHQLPGESCILGIDNDSQSIVILDIDDEGKLFLSEMATKKGNP